MIKTSEARFLVQRCDEFHSIPFLHDPAGRQRIKSGSMMQKSTKKRERACKRSFLQNWWMRTLRLNPPTNKYEIFVLQSTSNTNVHFGRKMVFCVLSWYSSLFRNCMLIIDRKVEFNPIFKNIIRLNPIWTEKKHTGLNVLPKFFSGESQSTSSDERATHRFAKSSDCQNEVQLHLTYNYPE